MSCKESSEKKSNKNSNTNNKEKEIIDDEKENKIKLIKRTLENNTHEVIEDTKYYILEKI